MSGTRRIAFATKDAAGFISLRSPLLAEATRRRHAVLCIAPDFDARTAADLERLGIHFKTAVLESKGFNLLASYRARRDLAGALSEFAPHTVAITDADVMPVMLAAAERARVRHLVPMLAEFPQNLDKAARRAFAAATAVIVETPDSGRAAASVGVLNPDVPVVVMPASGIDLKRACVTPLPPIGQGLTFVCVSATSDSPARETFAAAARVVQPHSALARFIEAGIEDAAAINAAHVVVHSSALHGLAPGLLAGLAAGRPLITSDVAGAREAVDERVNGCRFQPGSAGALAEAMLSFLRRPHELTAMARASRAKAERRFDVGAITTATLEILGLGESFAAAA